MSAERKRHPRRLILRTGLVLGVAAAADQLPRLPELGSSQSGITFDARQTEIMRQKNAACIVFAPSNFANGDKIANWVKPALEPLGGVGSVQYANDGLHTEQIAAKIKELKQSGVTEFSFYVNSLGAQVAGKTMLDLKAMGEDINLKHILMDCVPPSFDYLRDPGLAKFAEALPPLSVTTAYANYTVHKGFFDIDGTYPGLWDEQLQTLSADQGEYYLHALQEATHWGTRISLLTPADPEKDTLVNAFASRRRLGQMFPGMRVFPVGGRFQQHGVFDGNVDEYHEQITSAIAA